MDLEMPGIDRWEAVRRLKNDPQTRDIPIIGMSAYALDSEREQAIATGCDEFDAKPIEFESPGRNHSARACEAQIDAPPCADRGWRAARQAHGEHRALARLARHRHVAAHHARELAGDGEAQARCRRSAARSWPRPG